MGGYSDNSLGPGFRFHPTDEELVRYYLRRKVSAKAFRFDPITVVDIYKFEPWHLPDKSKLKSRDLEWYFFSVLDKKNSTGSRMNRATENGYWKTTGKDRPVQHYGRTVGMKKTLVYHSGRPPRGERSNWVMHEYRLDDADLEKARVGQDAFVLCRIFQKSGSGPKNGEQYGAPFIEEEWEDNDVAILPGQEAETDEVVVADDDYLEVNNINQEFDVAIPLENEIIPPNLYYGNTSKYVEPYETYIENDQNPKTSTGENQCASELHDDRNLVGLLDQVDAKSVEDELIGEPSSNNNLADANFLLEEPYLDTTDFPQFDDGLFLETNDLSDPVEADHSGLDMLEEYLTFFDADGDTSEYMAFDPSILMGSENSVPDDAPSTYTNLNDATEQLSMTSQHLFGQNGNNDASSSKQNQEDVKSKSGFTYPFIKHASRLLGDIPAPPAYASEFPAKDMALQLTQATQSSHPVHVTAGMIRIRNTTLSGNGMDWSIGKNGNINITLSFGLSQGDDSSALMPITSILSGKTGSFVPRGWSYLMFIWVLILVSVSFKIGSCIYTR